MTPAHCPVRTRPRPGRGYRSPAGVSRIRNENGEGAVSPGVDPQSGTARAWCSRRRSVPGAGQEVPNWTQVVDRGAGRGPAAAWRQRRVADRPACVRCGVPTDHRRALPARRPAHPAGGRRQLRQPLSGSCAGRPADHRASADALRASPAPPGVTTPARIDVVRPQRGAGREVEALSPTRRRVAADRLPVPAAPGTGRAPGPDRPGRSTPIRARPRATLPPPRRRPARASTTGSPRR